MTRGCDKKGAAHRRLAVQQTFLRRGFTPLPLRQQHPSISQIDKTVLPPKPPAAGSRSSCARACTPSCAPPRQPFGTPGRSNRPTCTASTWSSSGCPCRTGSMQWSQSAPLPPEVTPARAEQRSKAAPCAAGSTVAAHASADGSCAVGGCVRQATLLAQTLLGGD